MVKVSPVKIIPRSILSANGLITFKVTVRFRIRLKVVLHFSPLRAVADVVLSLNYDFATSGPT